MKPSFIHLVWLASCVYETFKYFDSYLNQEVFAENKMNYLTFEGCFTYIILTSLYIEKVAIKF